MFFLVLVTVTFLQGANAPGLVNLGNTCYMNATLQCLRAAPELEATLISYARSNPPPQGPAGNLTRGLGELYSAMQAPAGGGNAVRDRTTLFVMLLRALNPQFAQQTHGHYSQQDANECWGAVMTAVKQGLGGSMGPFVDRYFGIEKVDTMTCAEAPEEAPTVSTSHLLQLSCHIEKDTGFVTAGLQKSLVAELEKTSPTLGRNALYQTKSELSRLPTYLTINFVRFYFKQDAQENCKIRKVPLDTPPACALGLDLCFSVIRMGCWRVFWSARSPRLSPVHPGGMSVLRGLLGNRRSSLA